MLQIVPAILEKEFSTATDLLGRLSGNTTWVQIDITDNVLTPGKTFELELLKKYLEENNFPFSIDVHLMVKEPINWINKCLYIGAKRITGQVEMMSDRQLFINTIHTHHVQAGIALDINTPVDNIPIGTDVLLLMSRQLGFTILPLDQKIYDKLSLIFNKYPFPIAVDGGVTFQNINHLTKSGVSIFNCTSAIFKGDVKTNIKKLNDSAND